MKSLLAVLVGYLVFGIAAIALFGFAEVDPRRDPTTGILVGSTLYGAAFAALGGYLAARLAGKQELIHAMAVGCVIAVIAIASLLAHSGQGSVWSEVTVLVLMVPCAVLGGVVRARQVSAKNLTS